MEHIKHYFLGFLFFFATTQLLGQQSLLLKDGSKLFGEVISEDATHVKFRIKGTEEGYTIEKEVIESISKAKSFKDFETKVKGEFSFHFQIGPGFYKTQWETNEALFQARMLIGKKLNKKSVLGLAIAIENQLTLRMIPITVDYFRVLTDTKFAPVVQLSAGGSYIANRGGQDLEFDNRISAYFKPQIGFRVNLSKTPITFMMGYSQSSASYTYGWVDSIFNEERAFKRLSINVGLLF